MKKRITVLLLIFLAAFCSGEAALKISLAPRTGITIGRLEEILYDPDDSVASLLEWEEFPLFNTGLSLRFEYKDFFYDTGFDFTLPFPLGHMHDYDWENGILYSHSVHPFNKLFRIAAEDFFSYRFSIAKNVSVFPVLSARYCYNQFESGIGQCTRYGRSFRVYGIDFYRHSLLLFTGVDIKFELPHDFFLKSQILLSPFSFQYSHDYHHGVAHPFTADEIQIGFFSKIKFGLSGGYKVNRLLSLELDASILISRPDKGDLITDYGSPGHLQLSTSQKSGAAITEFNINFVAVFSIDEALHLY